MPEKSFNIIVNEEGLSKRLDRLIEDLGETIRSTIISSDNILRNITADKFNAEVVKTAAGKAYLKLQSGSRDIDGYRDLIDKLYKLFPELIFEDNTLSTIRTHLTHFNGAQIIGLITIKKGDIHPYYIRLILGNFKDDVVKLSVDKKYSWKYVNDKNLDQILFVISCSTEFLIRLMEIWLISDILLLPEFGSFEANYPMSPQRIFSDNNYLEFDLPTPFIRYEARSTKLASFGTGTEFYVVEGEYPTAEYCLKPILGFTGEHSFPMRIELIIPEYGGKIKKALLDVNEKGVFILKVDIENPLKKEFKLIMTCERNRETLLNKMVPIKDITTIEEELKKAPTECHIDLIEKDDIIDRWRGYSDIAELERLSRKVPISATLPISLLRMKLESANELLKCDTKDKLSNLKFKMLDKKGTKFENSVKDLLFLCGFETFQIAEGKHPGLDILVFNLELKRPLVIIIECTSDIISEHHVSSVINATSEVKEMIKRELESNPESFEFISIVVSNNPNIDNDAVKMAFYKPSEERILLINRDNIGMIMDSIIAIASEQGYVTKEETLNLFSVHGKMVPRM